MTVTTGARATRTAGVASSLADASAVRESSSSSSKETTAASAPTSFAIWIAVCASSGWLTVAMMPRCISRRRMSLARTPSFSDNSLTVTPSERKTGPVGRGFLNSRSLPESCARVSFGGAAQRGLRNRTSGGHGRRILALGTLLDQRKRDVRVGVLFVSAHELAQVHLVGDGDLRLRSALLRRLLRFFLSSFLRLGAGRPSTAAGGAAPRALAGPIGRPIGPAAVPGPAGRGGPPSGRAPGPPAQDDNTVGPAGPIGRPTLLAGPIGRPAPPAAGPIGRPIGPPAGPIGRPAGADAGDMPRGAGRSSGAQPGAAAERSCEEAAWPPQRPCRTRKRRRRSRPAPELRTEAEPARTPGPSMRRGPRKVSPPGLRKPKRKRKRPRPRVRRRPETERKPEHPVPLRRPRCERAPPARRRAPGGAPASAREPVRRRRPARLPCPEASR